MTWAMHSKALANARDCEKVVVAAMPNSVYMLQTALQTGLPMLAMLLAPGPD